MTSPEWKSTSRGSGPSVRDAPSSNGRWPAGELSVDQLLDVKIELRGDAVVLCICGEIDLLSEPLLRSTVSSQLDLAPEVLVLDLTGVTFLSSIGLAVLMAARQQAAKQQVMLRLVCTGHSVLRPMAITGLINLFEIYPDVNSAVLGQEA
jgi:anti-sigma B factor antagonist